MSEPTQRERAMHFIDDASVITQTTFACERLFRDLLALYDSQHITFNPEQATELSRLRHELRQRAENLELHIQMLLRDLCTGLAEEQKDRRGLIANDRRATPRSNRRQMDDRRRAPHGNGNGGNNHNRKVA